jgi:hypothetical protein
LDPSWDPIRLKTGTVVHGGDQYIRVDYGVPLALNLPHWTLMGESLELAGHFMCHVEGQRGPAYVHEDIEAARKEATRLACQQANRGHKVYVLKAVEVVEAAKPVLPEPVVTKL